MKDSISDKAKLVVAAGILGWVGLLIAAAGAGAWLLWEGVSWILKR